MKYFRLRLSEMKIESSRHTWTKRTNDWMDTDIDQHFLSSCQSQKKKKNNSLLCTGGGDYFLNALLTFEHLVVDLLVIKVGWV